MQDRDYRRSGRTGRSEGILIFEVQLRRRVTQRWVNVMTNDIFSRDLDSTGVTEIGRNSLGLVGRGTFGIGVMAAVFHCCGTVPSIIVWLNSRASGAANIGLRDGGTMPECRLARWP